MIFYFLFVTWIIFFILLSYLFQSKKYFFQYSVLILTIAVSGFRDHIGYDYDLYVNWYVDKTRDDRLEFGFLWVMNFFRDLGLNYYYLFFFFSFWTILFVFLAVKNYTKHSMFAFLFYILVPGLFLNSLTMIRQSFAVAVSFYAFHFLITKKYWIYFFLMALAIAIHNTAIITFFIFLFFYCYSDKIKNVYLLIFLLLSLIISQINWFTIFHSFFINTRYSVYFSGGGTPINPVKIVLLNLIAFVLIYFNNSLKYKCSNQKYFLPITILSVVITNVFAQNDDLSRQAYYFTIFEIIVFADLIFLEVNGRRVVLFSFLYSYCFGAFLYVFKIDNNFITKGSKLVPYKNLWYTFDHDFFMIGKNYLVDPSVDKIKK